MTDINEQATVIAQHCFQKITNLQKKPLLVAITGDSGSGKSYFSELIRRQFDLHHTPYTYIDHDAFLISRSDREPLKHKVYENGPFRGKTYWEILENWFRLDEYDAVIKSLRAGKPASYQPYKRKIGSVDTHAITVPPNDIVIFDTTMQTEKMDFVILIERMQEHIIRQKLNRDSDLRTPEQIIEMHRNVQGYYWDRGKPKRVDIIIDNNDFSNPFFIKR